MGLIVDVGSLLGVMALIVMIVNALKQFGLVHDGQAAQVSQGLQALAVIVIVGLQYAGVDVVLIEHVAQSIADLGVALLALVPLFMNLNSLFHDGVKGLPLIGFSYSEQRANS